MSNRFETLKTDFKTKVRNSGFKNSLPLEDLPTAIYHLTISGKKSVEKKQKRRRNRSCERWNKQFEWEGKGKGKKRKISSFGGIVGLLLRRHKDQMDVRQKDIKKYKKQQKMIKIML